MGPGRLAVLERWLPYTVNILDRFRCTTNGNYLNGLYIHVYTKSIMKSTPVNIAALDFSAYQDEQFAK